MPNSNENQVDKSAPNARLRADGMPSLNVDMNTLALRLGDQRQKAPQTDKTLAL